MSSVVQSFEIAENTSRVVHVHIVRGVVQGIVGFFLSFGMLRVCRVKRDVKLSAGLYLE